MFNKIKILMAAVVAVMMMGGVMTLAVADVSAADCPPGSKNKTYSKSIAECNVEKTTKKKSLFSRVKTIINVVLGVLGVVTVAMIILGGIQYTTSAGDAGKIAKAKNTILYAVIGLIVALLAFAIVNFVLTQVFET